MSLFRERELRSVTVKFDGENPVEVYFKDMNLYQMDILDKAREKGSVEALVTQLVVRALDENGDRMFTEKDRSKILREFEPDAVIEVNRAMNKAREESSPGN